MAQKVNITLQRRQKWKLSLAIIDHYNIFGFNSDHPGLGHYIKMEGESEKLKFH